MSFSLFAGFRGTRCEVNINDCESHKCANGSTCKDGINNYTCLCPPTYKGKLFIYFHQTMNYD